MQGVVIGLGLDEGKITPADCKECRYYQSDEPEENRNKWCMELCGHLPNHASPQSKGMFQMLTSYNYRMLGGEQMQLPRPYHFAIGVMREKQIQRLLRSMFSMPGKG